MIRAGEYKYRLTIHKEVETTDSEGFTKSTWSDLAKVWAAKQGLTGREFFAAAAINAENMTRWRIRYRADLDASMRIYEARTDKTYDITSIYDESGDKEELVVMTKEVVDGG